MFAEVTEAVAEIRAGRMVVVVDDEDRENEGDLTLAAEFVTPEAINFMASYGRGLICLTLTEERADYLRSDPMTQENTSRFGTAFTEIDRGPRGRDHRNLGRRPLPHDPGRDRSQPPPRTISPAPATSSRCGRARAACWCAPARPRPPSISRAWPVWFPQASSARS